jgi:heme A synthase
MMTAVLAAWIWRNRRVLPVALTVCAVATGAAIISVRLIPSLAGPDHALTRGLIIMHVNIWSFALAFAAVLLATERDRWRHGERWVQWLAFGAFLLVCVQGTLGGLRVTQTSIVLAMIHACTAQAFLCLTVAIAAALSPRWSQPVFSTRAARHGVPAVQALAWTLVGAIYCQLIIAAVMRHLHAGLAIPTFPLAFGRLIPPMSSNLVAINFAHRVAALVVTVLTLGLTVLIVTTARGHAHARITRTAIALTGFLILQIGLGAYVIWSARNPVITSLHVVNGAIVLGIALLLAMRATRLATLLQPESPTWGQAPCQGAHA